MRALVIDDSRAMRMLIARTLRPLGFEILEAAHGGEALAALQASGAVELAVVDWNMPEVDGLQFVEAARAQPAYADMRIMMVTTEAELARIEQALTAGANEYVTKPFTDEVLRGKLAMLGFGG
jgi:two-component system chemotaxis response regulator CheY